MTKIIKHAIALFQHPHRALVAVPTTQETIDDCADRMASREFTIVGDAGLVPGAIQPALYLHELAQPPVNESHAHAIIFTDQFVHAPESVTHNIEEGLQTYASSIELVASLNHGVVFHAWTIHGFVSTSDHGQTSLQRYDRVSASIRSYYRSCDRLGAGWLARDRQIWRQHTLRLAHTARTIRSYESALMISLGGSPLTEEHRSLLSRLGAVRKRAIREGSAS